MTKHNMKSHSKALDDCPAGSLPKKHFAILVEGAWIFTKTGGEILATCPITASDHQCNFGIWNTGNQSLDPAPGFESTVMQPGLQFRVEIDANEICNQSPSYEAAFDAASNKYPFVYIKPQQHGEVVLKPKLSAAACSPDLRAVRFPLPTSIRAAGEMTTAEVGGPDRALLSGLGFPKRAHVTFIFIYEYSDSLTACLHTPYGASRIQTSEEQPTPHIIFKISPIGMQNSGESLLMHEMSMQMRDDDSGEKNHTADVFEMMRGMLPCKPCKSDPTSLDPLDIALYHTQDPTSFDCGDSGLTRCELGILSCEPIVPAKQKGRFSVFSGPHMAGCAGGGVVSDPGGGGIEDDNSKTHV